MDFYKKEVIEYIAKLNELITKEFGENNKRYIYEQDLIDVLPANKFKCPFSYCSYSNDYRGNLIAHLDRSHYGKRQNESE